MGQLTITLSDELENEVRETVRQGKYGSVSDFVRDAIQGELSARPTYWERFIAVQVLENNKMLKELTHSSNQTDDELLEALRSGYTGDYNLAEELVYSDELPREGSEFVHRVLSMYGELQNGYKEHGESDEELGEQVLFEGFDGNAGDHYLGYANFLVDNGRYTYVQPLDKIPHLNSHFSVNAMYQRMLDEYDAIKSTHKRFEHRTLSLEEVKRIVSARIHPEFRK